MKALVVILCSLLSLPPALAQEFVAGVNKNTVSVGERFQLSYTLKANGKHFTPPSLGQFLVLSGPNQSSNMQWVNGSFSSSLSYSYILQASHEGTFTIEPATISVNGKTLTSNPVTVTVMKGNAQAHKPGAATQAQPQPHTGGQGSADDMDANVFMKLYVDKRQAYVGEELVATYKLYVNPQVVNYQHNRPVYNGFYTQEIEVDPNAELTQEFINGKQFTVATMKKVVLIPQKTGNIEVPPLEMELVLRVQEQGRSRSIFDQFFGSYRNVRVEVASNKESVNVKPLPATDQPGDFTGAVGQFKLHVSTDRTEIAVNEAVNLSVAIEGKGNLELIAAPEIGFPADFETYDPKTRQNIAVTGAGTSGKKIFEYVVIPRYAGEFELKPITLSYFDPATATYKRLSSEPIVLHVEKGTGEGSMNEVSYLAHKKEDVQIIGKDIRFIKTDDPKLQPVEERFFGSGAFIGLSAAPFAGMGLAVLLVSMFRARQSDVLSLRSRKASALAKKHFSRARKVMHESDMAFYEEIYKALYGYLSDKFAIPVSELNREAIDRILMERQVPEDVSTELRKTLDECEMARFAPGVVRGKDEILNASTHIIEKLENEV